MFLAVIWFMNWVMSYDLITLAKFQRRREGSTKIRVDPAHTDSYIVIYLFPSFSTSP